MSAGKKAGMDMTQGTIWNKILLFGASVSSEQYVAAVI